MECRHRLCWLVENNKFLACACACVCSLIGCWRAGDCANAATVSSINCDVDSLKNECLKNIKTEMSCQCLKDKHEE